MGERFNNGEESDASVALRDEKGLFLPGTPAGPGRPQGASNWVQKFEDALEKFAEDQPEGWDMFNAILGPVFEGQPTGQFGPSYGLMKVFMGHVLPKLGIDKMASQEPTRDQFNILIQSMQPPKDDGELKEMVGKLMASLLETREVE